MIELLNEAKDLGLFKKVLRIFGDYSDKFPATGVRKMFNAALDSGIKIMPKDKKALDILAYIVDDKESVPAKVQKLLNIRFSDLCQNHRPIYKDGNAKQVAFWHSDGHIYDKVVSLLGFNGKDGYWSDADGKKVTLIDIGIENDIKK